MLSGISNTVTAGLKISALLLLLIENKVFLYQTVSGPQREGSSSVDKIFSGTSAHRLIPYPHPGKGKR